MPEAELALRQEDALRAAQMAAELQPGNIDYRHWGVVYEWNRDLGREAGEQAVLGQAGQLLKTALGQLVGRDSDVLLHVVLLVRIRLSRHEAGAPVTTSFRRP